MFPRGRKDGKWKRRKERKGKERKKMINNNSKIVYPRDGGKGNRTGPVPLTEENFRKCLDVPRTRIEIMAYFTRARSTIFDRLVKLEIAGKIEKDLLHVPWVIPRRRKRVYWKWIE
jgi:hypothetical protein